MNLCDDDLLCMAYSPGIQARGVAGSLGLLHLVSLCHSVAESGGGGGGADDDDLYLLSAMALSAW